MGVLFNDPDVDYDDIYWYFMLASQMHESIGWSFTFILFGKSYQHISCCIYLETLFRKSEGLIFTDKKLDSQPRNIRPSRLCFRIDTKLACLPDF